MAKRLQVALQAVRGAGDLALRYFRGHFDMEQKSDGSPVTNADRESERLIRGAIAKSFSSDLVLGEEFGETEQDSSVAANGPADRYRWIIDPIDGTISFVHGVPLWGMLIGIERTPAGGTPRLVAGVIHMAALGETVYASEGGGAWHVSPGGSFDKPVPARVSAKATLAESVVCTSSHEYWAREGLEAKYLEMCRSGRRSRGWTDCYAHLLVATGRVEAVVEASVHPWDVAALIPIIREAGGRCTDWTDTETMHSKRNLATNGLVHGEMLGKLSEHAPRA